MRDPRTDLIAREAARLIQAGDYDDIDDAINAAAGRLGHGRARQPSRALVRKHAQGMAMQALGSAAYDQQRITMWRIAEELMTMLEHALPPCSTILAGRAAAGYFDAGVKIHIRLFSDRDVTHIARLLIDHGYGEPQFLTAETRQGRVSQIALEEMGFEIVISRCPSAMIAPSDIDLFTGKPIETLDLSALRELLASA